MAKLTKRRKLIREKIEFGKSVHAPNEAFALLKEVVDGKIQ